MNEIIKTAREEVKSLNSDDLVLLWGRVNDISKNNVKDALKSIPEFVNEIKESKVVIISSPHRHDLSPESCVNQDVVKFNRQVKKILKLQSQAKCLEIKLDRNHFTHHGLHLNFKLSMVVQQLFSKKQTPTKPIPWNDPPLVGS